MSDSVGSVSVDVVPDARGWAERLRAQIRDFVATIKVNLDAGAAHAEIEGLRAEMESIGDAHADVDVDTAAANAKLDDLIVKEDDAARTRHGRVDVDTSGGLAGLQGVTSSLGLIPTLAATAGSALVPLGAALAGLAGAFGASALAGGGGVGAFEASAIGNISSYLGAQKNLTTQQNAVQAALASQQSAVFAVANAEASLSSAQRQQQAAQQNLTMAREAARQELASLTDQIRGAQLAEGDASIALREARLHLQQILANPTSSKLDIDAARQQVRDAQFQLEQARKHKKQTQADAAQARRDGVAGNAQVVAAQNQLVAANASVASAHRSVAQARTQEALATTKLQQAQHKLGLTQAILGTPAAKEFGKALTDAKDAWKDFLKATAAATFGDAAKALGIFSGLLPTIARFSNIAARAISGLLGEFGRFTHSAEARGLESFFERFEGPAIRQFGHIVGGFTLGLIGFLKAFAPLGLQVGSALEGMARSFEHLGLNASKSKGFQGFLAYVQQVAPSVKALLGSVGTAIGHLVQALAPLGVPVLHVITGIFDAFNAVPIDTLTQIAAAIAGIVVGLRVLSGLSAAVGFLAELDPAVLIVTALAGGFYLLYEKSKPFRNIIHDVGDYFSRVWIPKIKEAAHQILPALKDAFHSISKSIKDNKPFLEAVGKALAALTGAAIVGGLKVLAGLIKGTGKVIGDTIAFLHKFADALLTVARVGVQAFGYFVKFVLGAVGKIVDATAAAFGWLPHGIGKSLNDAQAAFHAFADRTNNNIAGVAQHIQDLQDKIDGIGNSHPSFKVTAETLAAQRALEALQRYRINDKTFTIKGRLELERIVGPGGGIGHPLGGPTDTSPRTTINVGKVEAHDYRDFTQQMDRRRRQAALSSVG